VRNLAGRTSITELIGVTAQCAAFLSNDSGAMHLAAALDVPVVAVFGPTREWATAPLPGPSGWEMRNGASSIRICAAARRTSGAGK
jgi:ADP-heptose:LPS heptosyltransferase